MNLDIFKTPDCPYYYKNICCKASEQLGVQIIVSPPVCNITCKKYDGPYGGRAITTEQQGKWLHTMLKSHWGQFLNKVSSRYSKPISVHIPPIADKVKDVFKDIRNQPWCGGIGLTGSILSKNDTHKDIDVSLLITDMRSYIDALPLPIPKSIDGISLDVFATTERCTFFMILDIENNVLYKSGLYNIIDIDPKIEKVVDVNHELFSSFRNNVDQNVPVTVNNQKVLTKRPTQRTGGCGCSRSKK